MPNRDLTIFSGPIEMDININITAITITLIQILKLHFKTLVPSRLYKGNRLNTAKKLLTEKPIMQIKNNKYIMPEPDEKGDNKAVNAPNINANTILAIGPANAILPLISSETSSDLISENPGDANTTPKKDDANATNNPKGHNLNSAWQSYFIATYLCASSWDKDPITTPITTIGKAERIP